MGDQHTPAQALDALAARIPATANADREYDIVAAALARETAATERYELLVKQARQVNRAWKAAVDDRDAALARETELRKALADALDCKGQYEGTVSERGGYPALCMACVTNAQAALHPEGDTPDEVPAQD